MRIFFIVLFLILLGVGVYLFISSQNSNNEVWYTGEVEHEGFPLLLRFPEKPDFDKLQIKYTRLLVVTHTLDKVKSSGLPEDDYNKTLFDLDHDLITEFEKSSSGKTVLIETFGGRRTYYIYISINSKVNEVTNSFKKKYPQHKLEWELVDANGWKLIRQYSKEYNFYN